MKPKNVKPANYVDMHLFHMKCFETIVFIALHSNLLCTKYHTIPA